MSRVELRDADFASPLRARSLLTVAAAICFARLVERPCFFSLSLMCSYCRSRFAPHACCGIENPFLAGHGGCAQRARELTLERRVLHVVRRRVFVRELVDDVGAVTV